ncbi:MAG: hypothetical protein TECD_00217 [Hyphomicrobiaceae bacterium hypho_1]
MSNQMEREDAIRQQKQVHQTSVEPLSPAGIKALKVAIAVMGAMILICVIVIIGRIIHISSESKTIESAQLDPLIPPSIEFILPAGTRVQHVSLDGPRAVVTFQIEGQTKVGIFDLYTGKRLTEISFLAQLPFESQQ